MSQASTSDSQSAEKVSDYDRQKCSLSTKCMRCEVCTFTSRKGLPNRIWGIRRFFLVSHRWPCFLFLSMLVQACFAQVSTNPGSSESATTQNQLAVNWLYGAYIPKNAPIEPLTGDERYRLFIRQSFTTPGIYIKTGFFAIHDQVRNAPPQWNQDFGGFAKRVGTRQTQFLLQNSFTSLGNAMVGWEPRYDRCKCDGFWPRTRHGIVRNFVTYDRSEKHLRPQLMPYVGSFGAGVITATWQPGNPNYLVKGYQSAVTQAWVGSLINVLGEFAPDITRKLKKHKK
jgi:hypothetical protein